MQSKSINNKTALPYHWFIFFNALPLYNNITSKNATIGGTKSFAGFDTSKACINYAIAIIGNKFEGSSSSIVKKLITVLDALK